MKKSLVAVFLVLIVVMGVGVVASRLAQVILAQAEPGPTLVVGGNVIRIGEELSLPVAVDSLPRGLAGYQFEVTVSTGTVMHISRVSSVYAVVEVDTERLRYSVVDLAKAWGVGGHTVLLDVTVVGDMVGQSGLLVTPLRLDDELGGVIGLAPTSVTVTVYE